MREENGKNYLSGVELFGIDGKQELRLALVQLDSVRVNLQEPHPALQKLNTGFIIQVNHPANQL